MPTVEREKGAPWTHGPIDRVDRVLVRGGEQGEEEHVAEASRDKVEPSDVTLVFASRPLIGGLPDAPDDDEILGDRVIR